MRSFVDVTQVIAHPPIDMQVKHTTSDFDRDSINSARSSIAHYRKKPAKKPAVNEGSETKTIAEIPEVVNMFREPVTDEFEDRVRAVKLLELKRKKDIEEQVQQAEKVARTHAVIPLLPHQPSPLHRKRRVTRWINAQTQKDRSSHTTLTASYSLWKASSQRDYHPPTYQYSQIT